MSNQTTTLIGIPISGTMTTEPLAVQYSWGESANELNTFNFHEQYHGKDGFEAHQKTQHFADWESFAESSPFSRNPEVMLFQLKP